MVARGVPMTEAARLLLALQMGDSAFPSGGFGFSWGLETLKAEGRVRDGAGVMAFARTQLRRRWATADRLVLRRAVEAQGDLAMLATLDDEVEAMTLASELRTGSRRAGRALLRSHATLGTPGAPEYQTTVRSGRALGHLPVAQGVVWSGSGLSVAEVEAVSAFALAAGIGQAAVRLALMGPAESQAMIATLRPIMAALLVETAPEVPHSFAPLAEIAAMRHETCDARLFAN